MNVEYDSCLSSHALYSHARAIFHPCTRALHTMAETDKVLLLARGHVHGARTVSESADETTTTDADEEVFTSRAQTSAPLLGLLALSTAGLVFMLAPRRIQVTLDSIIIEFPCRNRLRMKLDDVREIKRETGLGSITPAWKFAVSFTHRVRVVRRAGLDVLFAVKDLDGFLTAVKRARPALPLPLMN